MSSASASATELPGPAHGRRGLLADWPAGTRLGALCLALMLVPGLLAGGAPLAALQVFVFYVGWVLVPGLVFTGLVAREEDELVSAALSLAAGTVLIGLAQFLCRATGLYGALFSWPLVALASWALWHARAPAAAPASWPRSTGPFLLLLVPLLVRVPTGISGPEAEWYLLLKDLVFHGGNAAELLNQGPLIDPRVAARPLNYHLLSHALAAAASVVSGESIADLFRFWFLGFYPLVLAMLVFALARALARSAWAGFLAVLALVLHHDLGFGLFGRQARSPLGFLSHLNLGIYISPTTCLGLVLLAAMARALMRWVEPERRIGAREVCELALFALGASMAKGSVMPPVIAGAGFAFVLHSLRARRWHGRWAAATLVLTLAALPATLYLSFGPGSYAGAMFRFAPWATATTSPLGKWLLTFPLFEHTPTWLDGLLLTIPWLPGFLGLGGIGTFAWFAAGRPDLARLGPWILGTCLAGLGAGVLLIAPGTSQLFFAYDAQLLLAILSGLGAVALWRARRGVALALAVVALPFVAAGLGGIARDLHERVRVARNPPEHWAEWCEAAAWLREHTAPGALLAAGDDGLLLTQFAERRVVLSEVTYAPEVHASAWQRVDGQWRVGTPTEDPFEAQGLACQVLLQRGTAAAVARLRAATGHGGELYLIRDDVAIPNALRDLTIAREPNTRELDASPALERVFRNAVMSIYRARR